MYMSDQIDPSLCSSSNFIMSHNHVDVERLKSERELVEFLPGFQIFLNFLIETLSAAAEVRNW
jgi:hypothetical protein